MKIIEKGCPDGCCKMELSNGELLQNAKGEPAVMTLEFARVRNYRGDYSPVAVADCYSKPTTGKPKEK